MRFHLKGLKSEETKQYILHRLEVAGATREIFKETALKLVHESTGGIPRRINQVCDLALLSGLGAKAALIDEAILNDVVTDSQTI